MIYIGIPVRDERHTIGPLLWRIREILVDRGRDFHVIVVDDASSDGTTEALQAYERVLPLTVLRNEEGRGWAPSLERVVREAVARSDYPKRDALVTLQGDFTDPPEAFPEMIRRFQGGADLVVTAEPEGASEDGEEEDAAGASRTREPTPAPLRVRLARLGARLLARSLPRPAEVGDPFATFRLYRLFTLSRAISDLPPGQPRLLTQEGWAANAELLLAVWPHVRRIERVEEPADYGRRYRESRFRAIAELKALRRATRDPRLRKLADRIRRAAPAG